jgi:hypothetical protein
VKTLPLPLPEMKKKEFVSLKSLDKKLFRLKDLTGQIKSSPCPTMFLRK